MGMCINAQLLFGQHENIMNSGLVYFWEIFLGFIKRIKKVLTMPRLVSCLVGVVCLILSIFASATPVTLGTIATTVDTTVLQVATIISDTALVAGIGFVMASFFKFDAHKKNPTQIPMSAPLTLLLIGASLCLFPTLMPLVQTAIFSTAAERGAVRSGGVQPLIG